MNNIIQKDGKYFVICKIELHPTFIASHILKVLTNNMNYRGRKQGDFEHHDSPWHTSKDFGAYCLYVIKNNVTIASTNGQGYKIDEMFILEYLQRINKNKIQTNNKKILVEVTYDIFNNVKYKIMNNILNIVIM